MSIITRESHPSIPINLNTNCSAGTGPVRSPWFEICSLALSSGCNCLWPNHHVTNHFVVAKNDVMTILIGWCHHKTMHSPKTFASDYSKLCRCGNLPNLCFQKVCTKVQSKKWDTYGLVDFTCIPRNASPSISWSFLTSQTLTPWWRHAIYKRFCTCTLEWECLVLDSSEVRGAFHTWLTFPKHKQPYWLPDK